MPTVVEGAMTVTGRLTPKQLDIPAETLTDAGVSSSAGIGTAKLKHRYRANFNQPNTTATTETRVVHVARVAGTIRDFLAGSIVSCIGAATIVLDLKKNGTTVLSSTITLDSGNTARVAEAGTLNVFISLDELEHRARASVPPAGHGWGRELFAPFRAVAGDAEIGGGIFSAYAGNLT